MEADFLIIGGGVAGLSAGARLAEHGRVVLLETETAGGFHSSGRSATFSHFGIGNRIVRALTACSRSWLIDNASLSRRSSALFTATEAMRPVLDRLEIDMAPHAERLRRIEPGEMKRLFPPLRTGPDGAVAGLFDEDGLRLDSDAMLQHFARAIRAAGGMVATGKRVSVIRRINGLWRVESADGTIWSAPVLINAAGAWADTVAAMAGAEPIGITPMRRTIIVVDPPAGADVRDWPFVKTAKDDFYILPESGRLMASPVDEIASDPCDAQPEEMDVALAAQKVETYTELKVTRISHRWAGLRSFAPDRTPIVGFDPHSPGFFWLAGQGGAGLQTAPAMAQVVEAIVTGSPWPATLSVLGVAPDALAPDRFRQT